MVVKIMIDLAPFSVPESVQLCIPNRPQNDGPTPGLTELFDFTSRPKLALSEIDADSLAALCDQFRRTIFEKAGKADPKFELKTERTGALWMDEMKTKEKDPIPDKDWVAMGHQMIDNAIQKRSDHHGEAGERVELKHGTYLSDLHTQIRKLAITSYGTGS